MKTLTGSLRTVFAVLAMVFLLVPNVRAASIFIDADNIPGLVTFSFGQFEGGFSINGSTPTTTGSFTFGDGTQLNFTGQWIDLGAATSFSRTVYWIDPNAPTIIHDILQWTVTPSGASGLATISGFFQSEGLGTVPPGVNPSDIIVNQPDGSHNPFNFSAAFLGGQVLTDSSAPIATPEPTSLVLLGLGLLAIGYRQRRRH